MIEFHFITGLDVPSALAVSDNTLFVATDEGKTVGKYDATTGAAINPNFITGLRGPFIELAKFGPHLFVANSTEPLDTVGKYNASTGTPVNASFITGDHLPEGLAVQGPTVLFHHPILFVLDLTGNDTVGKYDATTGAAINASFITGLNFAEGIAVSGNKLFVANRGAGTVGKYNATTGAANNADFITGSKPHALALLGNNLFVAEFGTDVRQANRVGKYDATTGAAIDANFITGILPDGLAVKSAK